MALTDYCAHAQLRRVATAVLPWSQNFQGQELTEIPKAKEILDTDHYDASRRSRIASSTIFLCGD